MAGELAIERNWELITPLPFGRLLNTIIAAQPPTAEQAKALLAGNTAVLPETGANAVSESLVENARLFELADQDEYITDLYLKMLDTPGDLARANKFYLESGLRFALAGRVVIEQSDLLVAVWDGLSTANVGGSGHTIVAALDKGVPVLWIDPARPDAMQMLHSNEDLARFAEPSMPEQLRQELRETVRYAIQGSDTSGSEGVGEEQWHASSKLRDHAYRRVEALFGNASWAKKFASVRQRYEAPDEIAAGSGAPLLDTVAALPRLSPEMPAMLSKQILRRFAWYDGIATFLSDRYRSGMTINFLLGSIAIVAGILYLPLGGPERKWAFASFELGTLLLIVLTTIRGQRAKLHSRWFETRRIAEYLRHSPLMLAAGVSRPSGRWPADSKGGWPELYARHALREVGLPAARVDTAYLRDLLVMLEKYHVLPQRDYHRSKAKRLAKVHHTMDRASERLFVAAVATVSCYLVLAALDHFGIGLTHFLASASKWFTVLGVALPTLGGALAGIRYFGDFERFAAISEATAQRLGIIAERISILSQAPDKRLDYSHVAELFRATDETVFDEIQSWQAVFSGKRIMIPV